MDGDVIFPMKHHDMGLCGWETLICWGNENELHSALNEQGVLSANLMMDELCDWFKWEPNQHVTFPSGSLHATSQFLHLLCNHSSGLSGGTTLMRALIHVSFSNYTRVWLDLVKWWCGAAHISRQSQSEWCLALSTCMIELFQHKVCVQFMFGMCFTERERQRKKSKNIYLVSCSGVTGRACKIWFDGLPPPPIPLTIDYWSFVHPL